MLAEVYTTLGRVFAAAEPSPADNTLGLVATASISSIVIAAIVSGVVQLFINRRNARITERRNTVDAESDIVARYKEAAAEERSAKESAVLTIRNLLEIAEEQIGSLKDTVERLTSTIQVMTQSAQAQIDVIEQLTADRDRVQRALEKAETKVDSQREELIRVQKDALAALEAENKLDNQEISS